MSDESRSKGFINRWSTRKQQSGRHEEAAHPVQPLSEQPSTDSENFPEPSAEPGSPVRMHGSSNLLAEDHIDTSEDIAHVSAESIDDELLLSDTDMPPIESLSADSDVSAFFNKGVSAALRKAALRHVFRQPAYNIRDGLNDYDGDYTVFEPLGDTVTSDMKWHIARKERERLEAEARELEQRRLEAQEEQEMEEMEETQAEQDSQAEENSQAEEEARTEQEAQEPQEPQEPHAECEAESHSEFEQAGQTDMDHKGEPNTRNKPA